MDYSGIKNGFLFEALQDTGLVEDADDFILSDIGDPLLRADAHAGKPFAKEQKPLALLPVKMEYEESELTDMKASLTKIKKEEPFLAEEMECDDKSILRELVAPLRLVKEEPLVIKVEHSSTDVKRKRISNKTNQKQFMVISDPRSASVEETVLPDLPCTLENIKNNSYSGSRSASVKNIVRSDSPCRLENVENDSDSDPRSDSVEERVAPDTPCRLENVENDSDSDPKIDSVEERVAPDSSCRLEENNSDSVPRSDSVEERVAPKSSCRLENVENNSDSVPRSDSVEERVAPDSPCRLENVENDSDSDPRSDSVEERDAPDSPCGQESAEKDSDISNEQTANDQTSKQTTNKQAASEETASEQITSEQTTQHLSDTRKSCGDFLNKHCNSIFCQCSQCCKNFDGRTTQISFTNNYPYAFFCVLCNKKYKRAADLRVHQASKCGSLKVFNCTICIKGFTTKYWLNDHIKTHHSSVQEKNDFKCGVCNQSYRTKNILNSHIRRSHHNFIKSPHTCEICKKVFDCKRRLLEHN